MPGNPNPNTKNLIPGQGRPKGVPNKFTSEVKDALLYCFDKLGGAEGLVAWAKKSNSNRLEFYKMVTRLMPRSVEVDISGQYDVVEAIRRVTEQEERNVRITAVRDGE